MSQRPRFTHTSGRAVNAKAFNELVDFYNELADAYEELYVDIRIEADAQRLLDGRTLSVIQSVHDGLKQKINKEGYEEYAKRALTTPQVKA